MADNSRIREILRQFLRQIQREKHAVGPEIFVCERSAARRAVNNSSLIFADARVRAISEVGSAASFQIICRNLRRIKIDHSRQSAQNATLRFRRGGQ